MGIFSGVTQASQGANNSYWTPGIYKARVERVTFKEKSFKGTSYIIECEVLEVLQHYDAEDRDGLKFASSRKVGERVTQVMKFDNDKAKQAALGNINNFLTACFQTMALSGGQSTEGIEVTEESVAESYADDQPCAGLELNVHCQGIKTAAGKAFVVTSYGVLEELKKAA